MFDSMASKYDQLNGVLSLGIDGYWRREALGVLKKYPHNRILDVATGTGDFAILAQKILKPESITAIRVPLPVKVTFGLFLKKLTPISS